MHTVKSVEAYASRDEIWNDWKRLEEARPISGYQTRRWADAWMRTSGASSGLEPAFILGRTEDGAPAVLFVLAVAKRAGLRIAAYAGGRDSNINMPLARADVRLDADAMRDILARGAQAAGIDAFELLNQPMEWRGADHPLAALPRQPSPSFLYSTALDPDPEKVMDRLTPDARKRYRWRMRKLEELGPVSLRAASGPEEVRAVAEAFARQKKVRIDEMGVTAGFNVDEASAFFIEAALSDPPGVELHALMAGDRIAAVYGAIVHDGRYHAMVNSYDTAPDVARVSPGEIITIWLLQDLVRRGVAEFDLGVGEAAYKNKWCERAEPLFDTFFGVTLKGKAYCAARSLAQQAKRTVKQSPVLWPLAQKLRASLARKA